MSVSKHRFTGLAAPAALLLSVACHNSALAANTTACDVPALQKTSSPDTTIVTAKMLSAQPTGKSAETRMDGTSAASSAVMTSAVAYCRVDGYVTTTNPGPNKVNFMVAMPERSNGRYVFTAQGGAAAYVPDPTTEDLAAGYVIASTDKGVTAANMLDFTFWGNPAQALDWGHRGVHVAAGATQTIAKTYYKGAKLHRYITGCSGGGLSVMTEAERYPNDFDGYVGGAMTIYEHANLLWGQIAQHVVRDPKSWLSPDDLGRIEDTILQKYDAADGVVDGYIWDPRVIKIDRNLLNFLSDAQYGTVELIAKGLDIPGATHPGYWLSNARGWSGFLTGPTPPPWTTPDMRQASAGFVLFDSMTKGFFGPTYNYVTDFDFNNPEHLKAYNAKFSAGVIGTLYDANNLKGVQKNGAKVLLWSGAADQAIPPQNILKYQEDSNRIFGQAAPGFIRTFFAPGMYHCRGGTGAANLPTVALEATARWVEKGEAPATLLTKNDKREFLLCPYPQRSVFKGGADNPTKLDVASAKNWACEK